jgi:hypothetical protein
MAFSPAADLALDQEIRLGSGRRARYPLTSRATSTRSGVAFNPDGRVLVTGAKKGPPGCGEADTGKPLGLPCYTRPGSCGGKPDGKRSGPALGKAAQDTTARRLWGCPFTAERGLCVAFSLISVLGGERGWQDPPLARF